MLAACLLVDGCELSDDIGELRQRTAEMSPEEKNAVSHRGRALAQLTDVIAQLAAINQYAGCKH